MNEWDALADGSTLLSLGLKIENNFESLSGKLFYGLGKLLFIAILVVKLPDKIRLEIMQLFIQKISDRYLYR